MFARIALAFLSMLIAQPVLAQVYQWRDEQGKVHFTDTPPPESRNVTEQKLQVNTIQGLDDSELQRTSSRSTLFEDDEENLNPGQLHQKGMVQCAAAIRRMPSLITETQKIGREAVRQKRATQAQLDDAMYKMDTAYKEMKRNEKACASDYAKGGTARLAVNCLADTDDVMSFGLCMKFGEWASTFGQ
ncbi:MULTISPECIES: DUF4124 domain-containing protein [Pseudomonas]|jgi:hypothetical protein|uniref:DUF4124 domain-containing protein n=1 Tax=Pseudomonas TaxID=286 RepID=UPI000DA9634D|nr:MULTISPECIES: DUF4124 domain-containing protein [Pseudomonas]MDW3711958.1 DUF4124 domain-containing protein [Pseudomonas sp. 2023EL-01195]PZE13603.1 DUF4124 domain-containing protein [Pseudomonas sp. 57B-090624]